MPRSSSLALLCWCLCLSLLWSAGCERAAPAPPSATLRVVALSPAVAIILQDMGRAGDIVGRHASDLSLTPALPICGDHIAIDLEALRRLRPTHVFTQWGTRTLPETYTTLASREGWATHDCQLLTLADIRREIIAIDQALPPPHTLARKLLAQFDAAFAPRAARAKVGRVLLLAGLEPPGALGPGSWHHQMLVSLGATPAIEHGAAWIELANEDLKRLAPDAIIVLMPRAPHTPPRGPQEAPLLSDDAIAKLPSIATLNTPALASKHIALIDDPLCLTPSSAMIRLSKQMDEVLGAWEAENK